MQYFLMPMFAEEKIPVYGNPSEITTVDFNSTFSFALKSSKIRSSYRVVVFFPISTDKKCCIIPYTNPLSLDSLKHWRIQIRNINSEIIEEVEGPLTFFQRMTNSIAGHSETGIISEQIDNINEIIKNRNEDIYKYVKTLKTDLLPNTTYIAVLMYYSIIPDSYNKNYIYWDDLWNEETWKEK